MLSTVSMSARHVLAIEKVVYETYLEQGQVNPGRWCV